MSPEFAAFTKKVVPYLNIMTRIETRPDDLLLVKLGYGGHPTIAFLSPEGEVLGRPMERTVASFEKTLVAIDDYAKLKARLAKGEKGLEYERYILEYTLMKLRGRKLVAVGKALKGLDAKQQARVDAIVLGVEVDDLVMMMFQPEKVNAAGKRMLEILDSGRCPDMVKNANAWAVLARYAENTKNRTLLLRCSAGLAKNFPGDDSMQSWSKSLAKKAAALEKK